MTRDEKLNKKDVVQILKELFVFGQAEIVLRPSLNNREAMLQKWSSNDLRLTRMEWCNSVQAIFGFAMHQQRQ